MINTNDLNSKKRVHGTVYVALQHAGDPLLGVIALCIYGNQVRFRYPSHVAVARRDLSDNEGSVCLCVLKTRPVVHAGDRELQRHTEILEGGCIMHIAGLPELYLKPISLFQRRIVEKQSSGVELPVALITNPTRTLGARSVDIDEMRRTRGAYGIAAQLAMVLSEG
jgi:hypothetical protein